MAATALVLTVLGGCAQARLTAMQRAYRQGRVEDIEPKLRELSAGHSRQANRAKKLLAAVANEKRLAASLLIDKGAVLREVPGAPRLQALEYYRLALSLLPAGDPDAQGAAAAVAEIEAWQRKRRDVYEQAWAGLVTSTRECRPDEQTRALAQLAELRRELDADASLLPPALAAIQACFEAGRHLDVLRLAETALALRLPGESLPTPVVTRMALSYARLPPRTRRRWYAAQRPDNPSVTVSASVANDALAQARALFAGGKTFEAVLLIDEALALASDGMDTTELVTQKRAWAEIRAELVRTYLELAEQALSGQRSEAAYELYVRILALEPTHEIALDRVQKLETLRRLKSGARS